MSDMCEKQHQIKYSNHRGTPVHDHLGNEYPNCMAMLEKYNILYGTFNTRIQLGWSLERALTTPVRKSKTVVDHLNNSYCSVSVMCRHYHISQSTYLRRLNRGLTLEQALTMPVMSRYQFAERINSQGATDHLGHQFSSYKELCNYYNISYTTLRNRVILYKWSLERALTTPVKAEPLIKDHLGNRYHSLSQMARAYNLTDCIVSSRLRIGWSLERALTTPIRHRRGSDNYL